MIWAAMVARFNGASMANPASRSAASGRVFVHPLVSPPVPSQEILWHDVIERRVGQQAFELGALVCPRLQFLSGAHSMPPYLRLHLFAMPDRGPPTRFSMPAEHAALVALRRHSPFRPRIALRKMIGKSRSIPACVSNSVRHGRALGGPMAGGRMVIEALSTR